MDNILISNPFLFLPNDSPVCSQDSSSSTNLNIDFHKSEFDESFADSFPDKRVDPVSSPTISRTSEQSEGLISMDNWAENTNCFSPSENIPLDQHISGVPIYQDREPHYPVPGHSGFSLDNFPELDFEEITDVLGMEPENSKYMPMIKEQQALLFEQQQNKTTLPSMTVPLKDFISNMAMSLSTFQENAPAPVMTTPPPRQIDMRNTGREENEVNRMLFVAPSPGLVAAEEQQEYKPDIEALGINNGQKRLRRTIKRKYSDSSSISSSVSSQSSSIAGPSSSKRKVQVKKEPKYMSTKVDDPTVRNAKAAKHNRDKKKQEQEEMRKTIERLTKRSRILETTVNQTTAEMQKFKKLYSQERQKNVLSIGIGSNITDVKKILEAITGPLSKSFGPMEIGIPEAFANIPARIAEDGSVQTFVNDPNNLTISGYTLSPVQDSPLNTSSYTTFHISPTEKKIRVDYNPYFH